jgi:uridylate kinase
MNHKEKKMLAILKKLKASHSALSVKAEFEAEGTRIDELYRLVEIARHADMKIALKIGGCEAIRDLMESKQIGVDYIIGPMVESPYALSKFIEAKNKVYSAEEQDDTDFLFNIETITTFNNLEVMMKIASDKEGVDGAVFGRVDFSGSLGLGREGINTQTITDYAIQAANLTKAAKLDYVVGGAVSVDTLPSLKEIHSQYLTRFETRKIVFNAETLNSKNIKDGLIDAVHFELLWLLNKREYYKVITEEDDKRIEILQSRWKILSEEDLI